MVERRVKTFDEQVGLDFSETVIKICREAEAVRSLLAQIVRQANAYPLAAHDGDVHILVEGLRSTEAARIA